MNRVFGAFKRADWLAIAFLILWPAVYFWPVTLGQGVWFSRDISRLYYPFALEFSRALAAGSLPLWTNAIQSGFPLLAEGHVAAFYPTNALMLKSMPADYALSYEMLLHLAWMGCGMYACARSLGLRASAALLTAFAFSFNGFAIQKIYHTPILVTAAWLPWLVFFLDRFQRARLRRRRSAGVWLLFGMLATGIQYLEGFPQIAFLNSLTFGFVGLFGEMFWNGEGGSWSDRIKRLPAAALWTALPILVGTGVAAIQLIPTAELIGHSTRVGSTMDASFNTSYAMPPAFLTQFVYPYGQGEPNDDNNEYWGYLGLMVLGLAVLAMRLRPDARTFFFAGFGLVCLSLTLGSSLNPLYALLERLPIFSFFRVPARYLLPFGFAAAILAGIAFEAILDRSKSQPEAANQLASAASGGPSAVPPRSSAASPTPDSRSWISRERRQAAIAAFFAILVAATIALAYSQSIDFWLGVWQILPLPLGLAVILVLGLAWKGRLEQRALSATVLGLTVFDLAAYAPPFLLTIDAITPHAYVEQAPRSLPALSSGSSLDRVFTDESIWPSPQAQRASLFPNLNVLYDRESAHAYSPLVFGATEAYLVNMSPAMFNLMNVRYFMLPLEPRRTDRSPTPYPALGLDVVENQEKIPVTRAGQIQVTSFTEGTAALAAGTQVAELVVTSDSGETKSFPLRVGVDTADWDYGRETGSFAAPDGVTVSHTIQGFWRSLGRTFDGYVYETRFQLAAPGADWNVVGVSVKPLIDKSQLSIESISLVDSSGVSSSVAALAGKDDFRLRYLSDTAAAWENLDLLPRAFLVHQAQVISSDAVFDRLRQLGFRPDEEVLLTQGTPMSVPANVDPSKDKVEILDYRPEQVTLAVSSGSDSYVVLDDSWYPGWSATVDGQPAAIYQADFIYRAVRLTPGDHTVQFVFRPISLLLGLAVSALSLLVAGSVALVLYRRIQDPRGQLKANAN